MIRKPVPPFLGGSPGGVEGTGDLPARVAFASTHPAFVQPPRRVHHVVAASLDTLAPDTDGQSLGPAQGAVDHLWQGKGKGRAGKRGRGEHRGSHSQVADGLPPNLWI